MSQPTVHDLILAEIRQVAEKVEMFRRDNDIDIMVLGQLTTALHLYGSVADGPAFVAAPAANSPPVHSVMSPLAVGDGHRRPELPDMRDLLDDAEEPAGPPPPDIKADAPDLPEHTLVNGDGTPARQPRNLASEWAGRLPSVPGTRGPGVPDASQPLPEAPAGTICPVCRGPYESHSLDRNAPADRARLPVILCDPPGSRVYLT